MREQQSERVGGRDSQFVRDLVLYTIARLGVVAAVIGVLTLFKVPFVVAAVVSVIVAMPLSMIVFGGLRRRVAEGMIRRQQRRAELKAQLRGEHEAEA